MFSIKEYKSKTNPALLLLLRLFFLVCWPHLLAEAFDQVSEGSLKS
jgi:hypothetical protein